MSNRVLLVSRRCRALCRHATLLQIAECSDEVGTPAEIAEHDESLHAAGVLRSCRAANVRYLLMRHIRPVHGPTWRQIANVIHSNDRLVAVVSDWRSCAMVSHAIG